MNVRQTGARRQREAHRRHTVAQREPEGQRGEPMAGGRMGQTTKHNTIQTQAQTGIATRRESRDHKTSEYQKQNSSPEAVDILPLYDYTEIKNSLNLHKLQIISNHKNTLKPQ